MDLTRRIFLGSTAAFAGLAGVISPAALAAEITGYDKSRYAAMRKQLRAFYPDECHGDCKAKEQLDSEKIIAAELDAYAAGHPGFDAYDIRRECYRAISRHFVPFLFPQSPFYFEAGINGGWAGARPARNVNRICSRFYKEHNLIPDEAFNKLHQRGSQHYLLCCGPFSDDMHHVPPLRAILKKGFAGVRQETADALAKCPQDDPHGRKLLETSLVGLDTIHDIQLSFAAKAKEMLKNSALAPEERRFCERIAESALHCPWEPPKTFFEGLNTIWFVREILSYVDGLDIYALGRADAWLIDLYRADRTAGRLTEEEARDLVCRFLVTADCHHDGMIPVKGYSDHEAEIPLTIGGCDKEGKPVYNELTRMFLDAHIGVDVVFPKLHCRFSENSPKEYLQKIAVMLMKGHAVFALFNDSRSIPQLVAQGIPLEEAREYLCSGCWDYFVDSMTDVDTANYMSVVRVLEATIYRDPAAEKAADIQIDPIDGAKTFEEVRDTVYRNFMRFFRSVMCEYTRWGRQNANIFPHPVYSACLEGCLKSRRDTTEGGVRFKPRIVTLAFLANVVDSLNAIKKVCFEDKTCTLGELLAAVRANWKGPDGERLRSEVLKAPYWGDNTAPSNSLMRWFVDSVSRDMEGMENDRGGPYLLAAWIYREYKYWGEKTRATPDGRFDGQQLAQGLAPSDLRCKAGATTVINAIGSIDHSKFTASNSNLSFDRTCMNPDLFEAVFRTFAKKGINMLQPNCFSLDELLDAQVHPELHQDLMIKVCGFTARFVALSKPWQDEVIARHRLK